MNLTWINMPAVRDAYWRPQGDGTLARFGPLYLRTARAGSEMWTWRVSESSTEHGLDVLPPVAVSALPTLGHASAQHEAEAAAFALSWDSIAAILDRTIDGQSGGRWRGWGPYARDVANATAARFQSGASLTGLPESELQPGYARGRADHLAAKASDAARTARTAADALHVVRYAVAAAGWNLADAAAPPGGDMSAPFVSAHDAWLDRCRVHLLLHLVCSPNGYGLPSNLCSVADAAECHGWGRDSFGSLPYGWTVGPLGVSLTCPGCRDAVARVEREGVAQ